jgi:thiol:disulfide interchange protein DsbD
MKRVRSLAAAVTLGSLLLAGALLPITSTHAATPSQDASLNALLDQLRSSGASTNSGDNFLPPDRAFQFSATADSAQQLHLSWIIAPGYYLYRDRIKVASASPGLTLGNPQYPAGTIKNDEFFGKQVIYHQALNVAVPVSRATAGTTAALRVTYQGCAEAGLCYPPITRQISLQLPPAASASAAGPTVSTPPTTYVSEQDRLASLIRSGNLLGVLATFWGLGLLLAFTPCCLPMVPILSGLIAGAGPRPGTARAFSLSLTYVLGMALTYTATGAAFAAAGQQVQAAFQQPWIIGLFAALFAAMALSMFGVFTVQMPSFLQTRLAAASNRQRAGHFGGVAIMGALSALIVTTCVAPPLVATLAVIGQSGAIARGSAALFAMSLGMGAPLLVVGTSAGRWLPKAGPWMDAVKRLFGVLMLALAAWMLTRVVPPRFALLLFAVPALAAGVVLWGLSQVGSAARPVRAIARVGALAAGVYAVALLIGLSRGSDDPLRPLVRSGAADELAFSSISSVAQLDHEVQVAAAHHQAVMLDFYADWCTSCKEMQRYTFTDPAVRAVLGHVRLLRADVTANTPDDQALLHKFGIYGPPTIAFYDPSGRERSHYREVGYMSAAHFVALLHQAFSSG